MVRFTASVKVQQLERDQSLIMVEGHHRIIAPPGRPVKKGVRRVGSRNPEALLGRPEDRRGDNVCLLGSESPSLAGMGIEAGHR